MSKKLNILKEPLQKEYINNKKSSLQIAKKLDCARTTIFRYLKKYNIPIRNHSKAQTIRLQNKENHPSYIDNRTNKKYYCIDCGGIVSRYSGCYGQGRCEFCASKLRWQNKIYREKTIKKILKANNLKPNQIEKLLNKLLQESLPNKYKFVGDGKVILGGFNPDFINCNGQKKIIELYGDYWHNLPQRKKADMKRLKTYKKYGYKTLIIWEHELKQNLKKTINRIKEFHYA